MTVIAAEVVEHYWNHERIFIIFVPLLQQAVLEIAVSVGSPSEFTAYMVVVPNPHFLLFQCLVAYAAVGSGLKLSCILRRHLQRLGLAQNGSDSLFFFTQPLDERLDHVVSSVDHWFTALM